jgi:hypothetical protein
MAGDGMQLENDCVRRWMNRYWSRMEMDCGMFWIATGYGWMTEVNDRTWMTGDRSQEMEYVRVMTINLLPLYEDIAVL